MRFNIRPFFLTLLAMLLGGINICATTIRFEGPVGEVLTEQLQAFLDSSADTLILPRRKSDYLTGPLYIRRDNVVLILDSGAVLRGASGKFPHKWSSLIAVSGRENVTILGVGAR